MDFHVHTQKDDLRAEKYRNLGNALFMKSNFYEALKQYNRSLCFATNGSNNLSLAYGNRSAVYLEIKQFDKCLENIKLARDAGYAEDRRARLEERERRCIEQMQNQQQNNGEDPCDFFKLSYPPNKNYPAIVNCLEMRENKKYGRYVIATQNLNPGDIIAVEETPFKTLQSIYSSISCAYCFKSNKLSLIPLTYCSSAMVCSQECLDRGKDKDMCAVDYKFSLYPRVALEAIDILDGNIDKLKQLMKDPELRNKTVFDVDLSNPDDPAFRYNQLLVMNSCDQRTANRTTIFNHPILKRWTSQSDKKVIQTFIDQLLHRITGKAYAPAISSTSVGSFSLFPFASLLTYSCVPNVDFTLVENKLAVSVSLPIKKGEQVFCNWMGRHQLLQSPKERKKYYFSEYSFLCSCVACLFDLSLDTFPVVDRNALRMDAKVTSINEVKEKFKRNCNYVKHNFKNYPCKEIEYLLAMNKEFLRIIAYVPPYNPDIFGEKLVLQTQILGLVLSYIHTKIHT